jgi:hypothetical protein
LCWLFRTSVQKKTRTSKPLLNEEAEKYAGKEGERWRFLLIHGEENRREDKKTWES